MAGKVEADPLLRCHSSTTGVERVRMWVWATGSSLRLRGFSAWKARRSPSRRFSRCRRRRYLSYGQFWSSPLSHFSAGAHSSLACSGTAYLRAAKAPLVRLNRKVPHTHLRGMVEVEEGQEEETKHEVIRARTIVGLPAAGTLGEVGDHWGLNVSYLRICRVTNYICTRIVVS